MQHLANSQSLYYLLSAGGDLSIRTCARGTTVVSKSVFVLSIRTFGSLFEHKRAFRVRNYLARNDNSNLGVEHLNSNLLQKMKQSTLKRGRLKPKLTKLELQMKRLKPKIRKGETSNQKTKSWHQLFKNSQTTSNSSTTSQPTNW